MRAMSQISVLAAGANPSAPTDPMLMTKFRYDANRPYGENRKFSERALPPPPRLFSVIRLSDGTNVAQFRARPEAAAEVARLGNQSHMIRAS
jgi:hypothetical protein